jgi:hypothetical protein
VNRDSQNLLRTKTIPSQTITMNDNRITGHFNAMTKASDTLFDGTPENWPIFKHHLLTEAENPTIACNQHLTHFQPDKKLPREILQSTRRHITKTTTRPRQQQNGRPHASTLKNVQTTLYEDQTEKLPRT